ncbi:MAG: hypothetical protein Q7U28_04330 [Aquabacterium sp.]|nr:hypothetical protein [Aquabacterium sp.]
MNDDAFFRLGLRLLSKLPAEQTGRVMVVTSARDGEGKTFVAGALAQAMAAQCMGPVALLSCSPDRRDAQGTGWFDLVHTGQWRDDMARATSTDNLSEISPGTQTRVETLFKPEAVRTALHTLRQHFSLVIIDGPSLPQCGALPRHADGALLVINAKSTRREVVQGALAANPIPVERLLGTVLNQRPDYVPEWLYRWVL